jgi:2-polyprenyl-3-methyl-5-hydroxy-6-metoxy-1,4-benzoquinol methylase
MIQIEEDENFFLENLTKTYTQPSKSPNDQMFRAAAMRNFKPYIKKPNGCALEFGCSDGFMTSMIASEVDRLTVVDGSKTFINMTKKKIGSKVNFIHSLFENFESEKKFDYIFACYVLEHIKDPIKFLKLAAGLLNENGLLFIVVPNARALSRQLARHMGLLDDLYSLTKNDIAHGHRRIYDRAILNRDIESAGLTQINQGGLILKLLADFQMDQLIKSNILGEKQREGLYKMGLEYPDLSGALFSVCNAKLTQS